MLNYLMSPTTSYFCTLDVHDLKKIYLFLHFGCTLFNVLTSYPLCPICRTLEEIVIYALRHCPAIKDLWKILIKSNHWPRFLVEILYSKKEIGKIEGLNWKLIFGEAVRRIWLRHNAFIYRDEACDIVNL